VQLSAVKGKVFRSDSGEAISYSYILLTSEEGEAKHFDTRTDEKGEYLFVTDLSGLMGFEFLGQNALRKIFTSTLASVRSPDS
jgi:hypothetical protein